MSIKLLGIISVGSIKTSPMDQIFYIQQILEKKWEYNGTVLQLLTDFKKAYGPIKREALHNILPEYGIPKKLVRLIKMCLNETYSKVCVGKNLSDNISYSEWPKTSKCSINTALQFCLRVCHQESPRKSSQFGIKWDISVIGLC
jgi:hypothetical protein